MGNTTHQVISLVSDTTIPFSRSEFEKLKRTANELDFSITTAATNVQAKPIKHVSSKVVSLSVITSALPAAGESMTIDLKRVRAGAKLTLLTSTLSMTSATVLDLLEKDWTASLKASPVELKESDYVECTMTYVAGGAATPLAGLIVRAQLGAFS